MMKRSRSGILFMTIFAAAQANQSDGIGSVFDHPDMAPAIIKGYKFFDSDSGKELFLRGIDYFPRPNDGVLDNNSVDYFSDKHTNIWTRDIEVFKKLGINAVRIYAVDPKNDHSSFMCALAEAGIYAVIGLAQACYGDLCAITHDATPDCYPKELKTRGQDIINEFSRYTNTLAFSAGNEVNHYVPLGERSQWNAPCLKKFLRDMRAYAASCDHMRKVPVGLISADSDRDENAMYYNCLSDPDDPYEVAEWYGINAYVFCDGKAFDYDQALGFQYLVSSFASYKYSIPVLLTEYGCISTSFPTVDGYEGTRSFFQAKWLGAEPSVREQFQGGFAFEYSMEKNIANTLYPFKEWGGQNYGIGYFYPEHCDDIDIPCEYITTPVFDNLKDAYAEGAEAVAANEGNITLDTFEVDPSRTSYTTCPSDWPGINEFTWAADSYKDRKCPSKRKLSFTCPNRFEKVVKSYHIHYIVAGLVAVAVATVLIFKKKPRSGYEKIVS